MNYLVVCVVALFASTLTFYSGFGLGTLLLPAFALFVPIEQAIALTAVVHLLNGLFKLALVGRHADRRVVVRFGLPAIALAFVGSWLLLRLARIEPVFAYQAFGRNLEVTPVELVIAVLLVGFALLEVVPRLRNFTFDARYLMLGGALSGFFGGLSGMQGALRSAFLARAGLGKEAFIATGVVIACLIDVSRLVVYAPSMWRQRTDLDLGLLTAAVAAAFAGALLGHRFLAKTTMPGLQRLVAAMLVVYALGLVSGWL